MGHYHGDRKRTTSGAPATTISYRAGILAFLRERGEKGLLGSELYARPDLYGRSARNRISELRAAGVLIRGKPHGHCDWWYRLIRDTETAEPPRETKHDFFAGRHLTGLPVFDAAAVQR